MASKGERYDITKVQQKSQDTLANFKYNAQHASDETASDRLPIKLKRTLLSREQHLFGDVIMDKNKIFSLNTLCSGWKIQNRNAVK
jgi:hypothetical protein